MKGAAAKMAMPRPLCEASNTSATVPLSHWTLQVSLPQDDKCPDVLAGYYTSIEDSKEDVGENE
jgi:hypothetical protein